MENIMLELDILSANDYAAFSPEMKKKVSSEVATIISRMAYDDRVAQQKKLVERINAMTDAMQIPPEILFELLRIQDDREIMNGHW